jgi:general secretion pathway protein I
MKSFDRLIKQAQRRPGGFTLLEIMVALAIIGTVLIALLSLGNRSLAVNDRLQRTTRATLLAQQKMAESENQARHAGVSQLSAEQGTFAEPFTEYRWQRTITTTPLPSVKMVTVTVLWGASERNEGVDVTSFLF